MQTSKRLKNDLTRLVCFAWQRANGNRLERKHKTNTHTHRKIQARDRIFTNWIECVLQQSGERTWCMPLLVCLLFFFGEKFSRFVLFLILMLCLKRGCEIRIQKSEFRNPRRAEISCPKMAICKWSISIEMNAKFLELEAQSMLKNSKTRKLSLHLARILLLFLIVCVVVAKIAHKVRRTRDLAWNFGFWFGTHLESNSLFVRCWLRCHFFPHIIGRLTIANTR